MNTKSSLIQFIKYHLPPVLFATLIITASSIQGLKSPKVMGFQMDKSAHFIEYFVFAFLIYRSVAHFANEAFAKRAFLISFLLVGFFAFGDEFYQKFVPNRISELPDLIADLAGAGTVLFLLWLRDRRKS